MAKKDKSPLHLKKLMYWGKYRCSVQLTLDSIHKCQSGDQLQTIQVTMN